MARRLSYLLVGFLKAGCAFCLLAMILLTCVDVIGRYLLNAPVFGALELTEIFLASLIFFSLPLITLRAEHVTVDLFDAQLSPYVRSIQCSVANILCGICTAFITYQLWKQAGKLLESGEKTAQLGIELGWLMVLLTFCTGLMAGAFILIGVRPNYQVEPNDDGGVL